MFVKTKVLGSMLLLLSGVAAAQTIDEIAELNRQAALAEAKSKVETAKRGSAAPTPLPTAPAGAVMPLPPGIQGSPAAAAAPAPDPAWKRLAVKKERSAPPVLMAIYGVGNNLLAELSEGGVEGKYRQGDKTRGGWTVGRIEKRSVDVTRQSQGKGKAAKFENVSLAFATKTEVPKEPVSTRETTSGSAGFSVPPLPSSFPASR